MKERPFHDDELDGRPFSLPSPFFSPLEYQDMTKLPKEKKAPQHNKTQLLDSLLLSFSFSCREENKKLSQDRPP